MCSWVILGRVSGKMPEPEKSDPELSLFDYTTCDMVHEMYSDSLARVEADPDIPMERNTLEFWLSRVVASNLVVADILTRVMEVLNAKQR